MRLLNVETLIVEEFHARNEPSTCGRGRASSLKGYLKILGCCEQARNDGFGYVWIDTCCIDKTSSSELTEAINSMFTWYRTSVVCYAFLEDIDADAIRERPALLGKSRWSTRGWTLQELIAPSTLVFYGAGWQEMGTRKSLVQIISAITGIHLDLFFYGKLYQYSVSQRMSWAAKRETTRVKDRAYCLLGIFEVNMTLLYGEGEMAFIRLQEEIMRRSDDQSIFAWRAERSLTSGLLAPSAACFEDSGDIRGAVGSTHSLPFFTMNKGIQITLPVVDTYGVALPSFRLRYSEGTAPRITITPGGCLIVALSCKTEAGETVALALDREVGDSTRENITYRRINVDLGPLYVSPGFFHGSADLKTIIVKTSGLDTDDSPSSPGLWDKLRPTFFGIRRHPQSETGFNLAHTFGCAAAETSGAITASVLGDGRGGAVFSRGDSAFGVFVGETPEESCWELVTGTKAGVLALAGLFKNKDGELLSSFPAWRLPLGRGASSDPELEVCLEILSRPHGFSIVFKVEERTGHGYSERAVETFSELSRRKGDGIERERIGVKKKRAQDLELLS